MTAWRVWGWIAVAAATGGCGHPADGPGRDAAPVAVHVRVAPLIETPFADLVVAPGQWRPANEIVVMTPFAAIVETLLPRVGDSVTKDETIGSLVTRESHAALLGAQLMLEGATDAAGRDEAQRALQLARREMVRVPLVAPAAGTVVRRAAEPGAELAEGAELLAIVASRDLVFEAHVTATDAARVLVGQHARIAMADGEAVAASVERRLPGVNAEDQTVLVWLAPQASPPAAAISRFGTARIEAGSPRRGVAVPDSALVQDDLTGETRVARVDSTGIAIW